MTRGFVSLHRIVALSVAITLFAAPIASAQTPERMSHTDAGAQPRLMNVVAFARLAQPTKTEGPTAVAAESPRLDLVRNGKVAVSANIPTLPMRPPRQQQNWFMRNPGLAWLIIGGGIFLGAYLATCGFPDSHGCD